MSGECVWKFDGEYHSTACNQAFVFNYHPPEPAFRFCPYCGQFIRWSEETPITEEAHPWRP